MEIVVGAIVGLCFCFMCIWAYRRGIKDGMSVRQNVPLEPIRTPVEVVKNAVAPEKNNEMDAFLKGLNNILNYDGKPQKEGE